MSNIIEFPNREAIYDQASLWIARMDRELTSAEQQELVQWLAASEQHRSVLFEMAELWDKMDSLARLADLFQAPAKPTRQPRFYGAIAASVALLAVVIGWNLAPQVPGQLLALLPFQEQVVDGVYETAVGEHSNVNLPDGSQLVLNTNSRITVKYSDDHRLFLLERGEINIEVAHDKDRPLSVMAGNKVVQAVGTAFNVRLQTDNQVALLVTDGKVLVAQKTVQQTIDKIVAERLPASALAVSKGEKIMLGAERETIAKVDDNEIVAKLSWRQGNLVFRGETLEEALVEINRYTSVQFEVADESIKQERIAGLFKAGDVDGLLAALEQNFNIHNQRMGNNKIRLSAK
ncbi:cytochrome c oxidase cbb3-type, subunit I [Cellvibrio sp. BR]|uniref:FecR family protein n=1 Tax=Cellvibrio sp. BR TaxID=1134474 RepID=UPI0002601094|nr:FecR domain-containing protein [Cellvibrio sp. BR]EIK46063.1 cytochrome c oxidase cbb3-type, subunit I [Cellvibrio sp. BR]